MKKMNHRQKTEIFWGLLFIAPVTIGLIIFYFYPFFRVIRDSFHNIGAFDKDQGFIGLENYSTMLQDQEMWQTLGNTFKYVIIIVPLTLVLALLVAVLLNTKIKGLSVFRVIYFLPAITMSVAVSMVWRWIYNGDYGILNGALSALGLATHPWLSDKGTALLCISSVSIWTNVGYYMIILLAGIQGISKGYYEAAEIDGASGWQKFVKITLPLLSPTIFYVVIMLIISTFQIFGEIYMMIGPKSQAIKFTQSVVMNFYRAAFTFSKKGYASAIAVLLFVIIMSLTVFQLKMQKKWVNYD
ncbi:MAG: sugar ABC transporter permease [Lachnospiraceae bacterium]|nr:sugar ABC transporter permease [Lachnospiraceae bacterium]